MWAFGLIGKRSKLISIEQHLIQTIFTNNKSSRVNLKKYQFSRNIIKWLTCLVHLVSKHYLYNYNIGTPQKLWLVGFTFRNTASYPRPTVTFRLWIPITATISNFWSYIHRGIKQFRNKIYKWRQGWKGECACSVRNKDHFIKMTH